MAAVGVAHICAATSARLPTKACAACGGRTEVRLRDVPRTYPFGLLFGIAFALPLLLALVIALVWGTRDLFDIMAGTGGRNRVELRILQYLPIVVPAAWSIVALVLLEAWSRRIGLRLSLCHPCASRQRWRRVTLIFVLVFSFVSLAASLYLIPVLALDERRWGILFAPWVILAALLATETPLAGIRLRPITNDVLRVRGAPAFAGVMQAEHPDVVVKEAPATFWPPRIELWALAVPAALVAVSIAGLRLERLTLDCPYGTYPLAHRSGTARIVGCRAPDGTAHGPSRGAAGAWNSNPRSPGFSGNWWFNRPHGEMTFLDRKGRARAQGHYVLGQARGRWTIFDEWGTALEELEVLASPRRTLVHRAHPHLKCSRSEIEATGMPAWGTRACPRYDQPAPFVRVENAVVVETGMR
jgi:hypothetical protein